MLPLVPVSRYLPLGLAYFGAAALSVSLTRFDGNIAFLWLAASFLIATLVRTHRRSWSGPLAVCGLASFLATGFLGLGWKAAPAFVIFNLIEAGIAAWLMRQHRTAGRTLDSLAWFGWFVFGAGVIGPLVGATLASGWLTLAGQRTSSTFVAYFAGHALGNLTFTSLALLVTGQRARSAALRELRGHWREAAVTLPLIVIVSVVVFTQDRVPLLFLPILPIVYATFLIRREGAAIAVVLLALVGGALTAMGEGPTQLLAAGRGAQLLFLQFYVAVIVLTVLPIAAELHSRRLLIRQLRFSEERYRLLSDHSTDIVMHLDAEGRIRFVSPSIRRLGGYEPAELIGRNANSLIAPDHRALVRQAHQASVAGVENTHVYEFQATTREGELRWFETHSRAVIDPDGQFQGVVTMTRDIDGRKANELSLRAAAMTDALTGLANRRAFRLAAARAYANPDALGHDCIAVFDIDHFKRVNDDFGHEAGDDVLRAFAGVARRLVRQEDLVARLGGEEFAVLFPQTTVEQALRICDRIRIEMAGTTTFIGDSAAHVTVSGGVAVIGPGGLDQALRAADEALYSSKRNGRDQLSLAA